MTPKAYYNENDPFTAQWLRNLIDQGLIAPGDVVVTQTDPVRLVDSAFGRLVHDRWGTKPKRAAAICSFLSFAMPHCVRAPACGRHPIREIRHMIRIGMEQLGCGGGSEQDYCMATAWLLFFVDISARVLDFVYAILVLPGQLWPDGNHQNTSTFGLGLGVWEISFRNYDKHDGLRGWHDVSSDTLPRTSSSKILLYFGDRPSFSHNVCTWTYSFAHYNTALTGTP